MSYSALTNLQNSTKESTQVEKFSQLWQEGATVLVNVEENILRRGRS